MGKLCKPEKKVLSITVSLIVVTTMFVVPLSMPLISNVVVLMDSDSTVDLAIETLQANVDDLIIVQKDSLEYLTTVPRAVGHVIWISHGNEKGVVSQNSILSWSDFALVLDTFPGRDIVLACDSERLYENEISQNVIALGGKIDSILGSLAASWLVTGNHDIFDTFVNRLEVVTEDPSQLKPLYWSEHEQFWASIDTAIWMLSALSTIYAAWRGTLNPFAVIDIFVGLFVLTAQFIKFISAIVGFLSGTMSAWNLFTRFGTVLATFLWTVFTKAPWYVTVIASGEISISIGTGVRIVGVLMALVGLWTLVAGIWTDQADADSIYGRISFGF